MYREEFVIVIFAAVIHLLLIKYLIYRQLIKFLPKQFGSIPLLQFAPGSTEATYMKSTLPVRLAYSILLSFLSALFVGGILIPAFSRVADLIIVMMPSFVSSFNIIFRHSKFKFYEKITQTSTNHRLWTWTLIILPLSNMVMTYFWVFDIL